MKVQIYRDRARKFRWRVRAASGKIVVSSGESFASRRNAIRAADKLFVRMYHNFEVEK